MGTLPKDWFSRVRLKLRHLELFVALDEQRNLHRAAAQLEISQPAASKLLGELESRLGTPLFERHSRGLTPNWYGELMVRRARSVLDELGQAGEEFNALQSGHTGLVRVGTVMAAAVPLLTRAVERLHSERPGLHVSINVEVSRQLVQGLLDGRYDFVLSRIPAGFSGEHFVFEEIGEEEICFVCSVRHPLARSTAPDLATLSQWPWALQPRGSLMRQRVEELMHREQLELPCWVVDTPDPMVSLALVDNSEFITVATRDVTERLFDPARFHILPYPQRLGIQPYGLVSLRHQRLSPGTGALMSTLRELMREPPAP
ncbi:LysR family transcriptional regulator [Kushneria sinocarnis]|uniref:LysR family transcriptional regulator n=1 Tax=Kushneria sinocarnis TaxID=595502 RepID=A0A420WWL4_9GAMM|nr:LysR substrate-binding domain-containing protein [Kushneria sinocarnis]RKR03505.1 LysR family transcriptional regulator [Kushneria sinocarnis]